MTAVYETTLLARMLGPGPEPPEFGLLASGQQTKVSGISTLSSGLWGLVCTLGVRAANSGAGASTSAGAAVDAA